MVLRLILFRSSGLRVIWVLVRGVRILIILRSVLLSVVIRVRVLGRVEFRGVC